MRRPTPLLLLLAGALGCASDMHDMMENMGGARGDRGPTVDMRPADATPPDAAPDASPWEQPPAPGPPLTLYDLRLYGSYKSYHLFDPPFQEGTEFEHPDFPTQFGVQGVRHTHFNIDYNDSNVFESYHHGLVDVESHCLHSLYLCFDPMGAWSRANPLHAPIVVVFEDNDFVEEGNFYGVLDVLHDDILDSFDREQIFTMDDLRAFHPGRTVREIVTDPTLGWPPLDAMRGRFVFLMAEPLARQSQRDLAWGLDLEPELLLWLYADGTSDAELAADDAAIAIFDEPADEAAAARIRDVVDRGYITWVPAHDAESWARADGAGAHLISTKYPDRFFPAPGAEGWPASCNPRTAPPGCETRQIENRRVPQ